MSKSKSTPEDRFIDVRVPKPARPKDNPLNFLFNSLADIAERRYGKKVTGRLSMVQRVVPPVRLNPPPVTSVKKRKSK